MLIPAQDACSRPLVRFKPGQRPQPAAPPAPEPPRTRIKRGRARPNRGRGRGRSRGRSHSQAATDDESFLDDVSSSDEEDGVELLLRASSGPIDPLSDMSGDDSED